MTLHMYNGPPALCRHGYASGNGGMVDTLVLEASAERRESSSLSSRTSRSSQSPTIQHDRFLESCMR
jgi:hypothetical protein